MKTLRAILLAGLLAGCASVKVSSFDRQGESYGPTKADAVVLFSGEADVDRPYRRIGALQWHGGNAAPDAVDAALREEAARIGADAVIKVDDPIAAAGPFFWPIDYRAGFAEAIRFED